MWRSLLRHAPREAHVLIAEEEDEDDDDDDDDDVLLRECEEYMRIPSDVKLNIPSPPAASLEEAATMPSASASSSSSPNPSSSRRSHEESRRRTSEEDGAELIPLPELNRSRTSLSEKRGGGFDDEDEDEDEDDLVVHESQGLLADEADSDTKHPSASPTTSSHRTRSTRPRPRPRAIAINRAWRKKLASLTSHKHYPYLRLSFFALLTLGALLLATFSLRSAFHVTTSHAPGSTSSSSHPPTNEALLATSLQSGEVLSNGTHEWRKTVILISLDGVKPDYVRGYRLKNVARLGLGEDGDSGDDDESEEEEEGTHAQAG
ncbi:hypothetical protein CF326_g7226, partial [Tilletia indica]